MASGKEPVRRYAGEADPLAVDEHRTPRPRADVQQARGFGKEGHPDERFDPRQELDGESGGQVAGGRNHHFVAPRGQGARFATP